jgi:3-methylfumaryl-CoA hydratase
MSPEGYSPKIFNKVESCDLSFVNRVASLLQIDQSFKEGNELPVGWHFFLLAGNIKKSDIRPDGFPGFGVPVPDLGLPKLVLGGRTVDFLKPITIGKKYQRKSFVSSIVEKETTNGRLAVVKIQHELMNIETSEVNLKEVQNFILFEVAGKKSSQSAKEEILPIGSIKKQITPSAIDLFQYSALGFNSHKIHLDKHYAKEIEGYPNLIVNGGLITLFVTEFLRNELNLTLLAIEVKHIAPLFCDNPFTIVAYKSDSSAFIVKVLNNENQLVTSVIATVK